MNKPHPAKAQAALQHLAYVLTTNGIACCCDPGKNFVYVSYESNYGAVFSIYTFEGDRFVNNSIYEHPVAGTDRKKVEQYLTHLNASSPLSFYIDRQTGCVTFQGVCPGGCHSALLPGFCRSVDRACGDTPFSLYGLVRSG